MRFFVSALTNSSSYVIYITTDTHNRSDLLDDLRNFCGPWLFLGIREYNKQQFLEKFSNYIPANIVERIENQAAFTYRAVLNS